MFNKSLMCFLLLPALLLSGCIITGKVIDEDGNGIEGVTVTLSGNADMTTTTDSKGEYKFGDLTNMLTAGSYTVTPSRSGCAFTPSSKNVIITTQPLSDSEDVPWPVGGVNFVSSCTSGRGNRYCEILLVYVGVGGLTAEVWGTQFLNDCPAGCWESLDPDSIKAQYGALAIVMNGPRYSVMDYGDFELPGQYRTYGCLDMQRLATLAVDPTSSGAYTEKNVLRESNYEYWAGSEIYELTSPDGAVYVMISMSQIVDPDLTLFDLPTLGSRLVLPNGWTYQARTLDENLVLVTEGETIVLTDDLGNTYQRR